MDWIWTAAAGAGTLAAGFYAAYQFISAMSAFRRFEKWNAIVIAYPSALWTAQRARLLRDKAVAEQLAWTRCRSLITGTFGAGVTWVGFIALYAWAVSTQPRILTDTTWVQVSMTIIFGGALTLVLASVWVMTRWRKIREKYLATMRSTP